jgi:hypothetical protein
MTPTKWTRPRTGDTPLRVQFRCGLVSRHLYRADQLRWSDTGGEWDIVGVEPA